MHADQLIRRIACEQSGGHNWKYAGVHTVLVFWRYELFRCHFCDHTMRAWL